MLTSARKRKADSQYCFNVFPFKMSLYNVYCKKKTAPTGASSRPAVHKFRLFIVQKNPTPAWLLKNGRERFGFSAVKVPRCVDRLVALTRLTARSELFVCLNEPKSRTEIVLIISYHSS